MKNPPRDPAVHGALGNAAVAFAMRPIAACVMLACCEAVLANPTGAQIVNGAASFARPDARTLDITNTPGAIINWHGFSIGAGEVTRFTQQSASSAVLNRVVGADISRIHGQLVSNGRVFLVNPAGIVIGAGAMIDTAGFVGSTLRMLDADFLAGKLAFQGDAGAGAIVNEGWVRAGQGGNIVLVAPSIHNAGVLETQGGQIVLAAGRKVTIGSRDLEGIQLEIQAPGDSVINIGRLLAEDGAVGVFAGTLRHSGDIRASAMARDEAGRIVLRGQGDVTLAAGSNTSANGRTGGHVSVQSQTGTTLVAGDVSAVGSAGRGGLVQILGDRVGLVGAATVNASGGAGGGTILVGGDFQGRNADVQNASRTFVGADATLSADAITSGDGGKVIVWADEIARFNGKISARGGAVSGDGGFVETSGKQTLIVADTARVDTGAPAGRGGTWLLDPVNIRVQNGGPAAANEVDDFADSTAAEPATVSPATLAGVTGGGVRLQADNDITFVDTVDLTANNQTLTAQAGRSILVNANITTDAAVTLIANETAANGVTPANRVTGPATITMAPDTVITANGANIFLRMNQGVGDPTKTSGNITIARLTANNVSILHDGPTANGSILRAATGGSAITLPNLGAVHMEIENGFAAGPSSSIGTASQAIPIVVAGAGGTAILEAHYHNGQGGIYINAGPGTNLQIGGATAVFNGDVNGVQTISLAGASGPIQISLTGSNTTLSQQALGGPAAVCGAVTGGAVGGPICAGAGTGSTNPLDVVTLRAADMNLQAPIAGHTVVLVPQAGGTIRAGSAAPVAGNLNLTQGELNFITAANAPGLVRIGESASGDLTFVSTVTTPGTAPTEFRTGGLMISQGIAGAADVAANSQTSNIILRGSRIGQTGAGRIKLALANGGGTSTVDTNSTNGGTFIEQTDGNLMLNRFSGTQAGPAPLLLEYATTNGDVQVIGGFTANPVGGGTTISVIAGGGGNIVFTGAGTATAGGTSFTLSPGGSTRFTSGTQVFNLPVITSRAIVVNGGTVTFNSPVTASTAFGSLTVTSGIAAFNNTGASTFTGPSTVSGGSVAGTGPINFNDSLTFSGGTISNSGGITIAPGTGLLVNGASPQLTGALITDTFLVDGAGSTLNIGAGGLLRLVGTTNGAIDGGTLDNSGTLRVENTATLLLRNGGTFINRGSGLLNFQSNGGVDVTTGGGSLQNLGGIIRKTVATGVSTIGSIGSGLNFVNSGSLDAQTGTLAYRSTNTFNPGTAFTGGGSNLVNPAIGTNSTFTGLINTSNLTLASGNYAGTASLTGTTNVTGGTFTGALTVPPGSTLSANGGVVQISGTSAALTNNGTLRLSGTGGFSLFTGATLRNNSLFEITSNAGFSYGGGIPAPTIFNSSTGTISKTSGGGSTTFGNQLILDNSGTLRVSAGNQLVYAGINNFRNGTQFTGLGTNRVFTAASAAFDGTINSQNLTLQAGNYFGSGTFNGTVTWEGGTIVGPLTNAGVFNLTGMNPKTVSNTAFTNNGGIINIDGTGNLVLNNASLPNQNGGTINIRSDAGIQGTGAAPLVSNTAFIVKSAGSGTSVISSALTNSGAGTISALSGTLQLNNLPQNSGTLVVVNGTIATNGQPLINNGTGLIAGRGTFNLGASTLTNNGTVSPGTSPGILGITGNYVQGSSGTLLTELGGVIAGSGFDQLQVSGTVALDGALAVVLIGGFTGAPGNAYEIITTGVPNGITGNFSMINTTPPGTPFTGAPGTVSYVLTQGGGSGSSFIPSPGLSSSSASSPASSSSSTSASMQSINDVVTLTEVGRIPTQEPQLEEQFKARGIAPCN